MAGIGKIFATAVLAMVLIATFSISTLAANAIPSPQRLMINGEFAPIAAYNVDGVNYFRLRDLAYMLNGTLVQFNAVWDEATSTVRLYSNTPYTVIGGEMAAIPPGTRTAAPTNANFLLDGRPFAAWPLLEAAVLNIDGSNFFQLRYMAEALGFDVGFNAADNVIYIGTNELRYDQNRGNITQRFLYEFLETGIAQMYSLALDNDGNLWAWWGDRANNRDARAVIEDPVATIVRGRTQPEIIMQNVIDFARGNGYAFAVTSDGILWGWGYNEIGNLGDGTRSNHFEPVQILDNIIAVETYHFNTAIYAAAPGALTAIRSYALGRDGSLWAWVGGARHGVSIRYSNEPTIIMENIVQISASSSNTMVIDSNGVLWAWGNVWGNPNIGLGDGNIGYSLTPVRIMDNVHYVGTDILHFFAIRNDQSLWTWGDNRFGRLMDGTNTNHLSPVRILDNVAFNYLGLIIRTDGSLYWWHQIGSSPVIEGSFVRAIIDRNVSWIGTDGLLQMLITTDGDLYIYSTSSRSMGGGQTTRTFIPEDRIMRNISAVLGSQARILLPRLPDTN